MKAPITKPRKPKPMMTSTAPAAPIEWTRADPAELAKFDPASRICTMNCGPHRLDPRTRAERIFLCDDCECAPTPAPDQLSMFSLTGLMPCPFCGQTKLSRISRKQPAGEVVPLCIQCEACGATGPVAATHDQLSSLWDVRASIGRTA